MEVIAKKARIRSAEKNRKFSSCAFADRVFLCATKKLEEIVSKGYWPQDAVPLREQTIDTEPLSMKDDKQTVLAAFMVHDSKTDVLKCVSLGMGTKFIDISQTSSGRGNNQNLTNNVLTRVLNCPFDLTYPSF